MTEQRTPDALSTARLTADSFAMRLNALQAEADASFKGRRIRFVGSFNGQPWGGRSRKSLAGTEAVITTVCLCEREGVTFCSHEPRWINAGFTLRDVEFV
jgi:hypothetical protein